jgi:NitT/TauT family transport system substrate-binding protein
MTLSRRSSLLALAGTIALGSPLSVPAQAQTKLKMVLNWKYQGPQGWFFLAEDKGYFKAEGLEIQIDQGDGSATPIPRVASGTYDIGFGDINALIEFAARKPEEAPIAVYVMYNRPPFTIAVKTDSPIKTAKDLEGKTVAVNTLNNICGVTINASLEKQGVDISKIKYTEIPFPEMNAALEKGRVDGACVVEPFVSQGKAGAMRGIDPFYFNTAPDLTVAAYFASKEYIAKNKDVVDRFVTAMKKSLDYAQANPDEVRGVLTEYTEIPPEAAEKINLPQWKSELTTDTIEQLSQLSKKYGYLEEEPDLNELIRQEG